MSLPLKLDISRCSAYSQNNILNRALFAGSPWFLIGRYEIKNREWRVRKDRHFDELAVEANNDQMLML